MMYLTLLLISFTITIPVRSVQIDVLKITNVKFPNSGCCAPSDFAASTEARQDKEIPEVAICYRMLIDSYNNNLFSPFASKDDHDKFTILDRICWKCGRESEGYQGGLLVLSRNIPGGGIGKRAFPSYHQYNLARDVAISKWTHICFSYSSITHKALMYQDGLKVFNFTFGDEKENPLPATAFDKILIGADMRGLFTDLQVYREYFNEEDMAAWTGGCPGTKGEIFNWDKTKLSISGTTEKNITIVRMDSTEVCPDASKPVRMKLPKISASGDGRRRFQPPTQNRTSYRDSVL